LLIPAFCSLLPACTNQSAKESQADHPWNPEPPEFVQRRM